MSEPIRIGIVGAGDNTRKRHLPSFQALEQAQVLGVVNSSPESTASVAAEFEIPNTFDSWQDLVASPEIDAVVIGTWPNLHCEIACAALQAGKHVLTEARMARNLAEARQMAAVAAEHPELIAHVVPSPFGMQCGPVVENLIKAHFLGDLREIVVLGANNQFWDYSKPIHPRQDKEESGNHILALGILHESLSRWAPEPVQVFAQTELFEPTRPLLNESRFTDVTVPDSVQVVTELKGGARAMYHLSGVTLFGPGLQIHLYGSRGTIKVEFNGEDETVYAARAEDTEMAKLTIPPEDQGKWEVESNFVRAIAKDRKVQALSFKDALSYMEFVEAVNESAAKNAPVSLPYPSE